MKIGMISFTSQGSELCSRLVTGFRLQGADCEGYIPKKYWQQWNHVPGLQISSLPLAEWVRDQFQKSDGLIFIGAAGIAVRAIAPYLQDKWTDPAVVVIDEKGSFAISLLSGHTGGANELAAQAAGLIGAQPVITTATDVNHKFAVDVFAEKNRMVLSSPKLAKEISASLLDGNNLGLISDFPVDGTLPKEVVFMEQGSEDQWELPKNGSFFVWITVKDREECEKQLKDWGLEPEKVLILIPKILYLGIGCRKGCESHKIKALAEKVLAEHHVSKEGLTGMASIDLKEQEPGICQLSQEWKLPYQVYPAELLRLVPGEFEESDFVTEVTGIGNVCERAACIAAGTGKSGLLAAKEKADGVTAALAQRKYSVKTEM